MREFMYTHLGVSYEVMALIEEEESVELGSPEVDTLPPPPAKLVEQVNEHGQSTLARPISCSVAVNPYVVGRITKYRRRSLRSHQLPVAGFMQRVAAQNPMLAE